MKKFSIEIKWAFIFLGFTLLWMLGEKLTGLHDVNIAQHPTYTNLIAIPAILIYVFALLDKRKIFYNGIMNYKEGFITGLIITVIITLFTPLTQYITSTFITPDYFQNAINYSVENGLMDKDKAEAYFNMKSFMTQAPIGALIMGILTAAIVALFTKKSAQA